MKPKTLKIRAGCAGGGKGALIQEDKSATLGCNNDQTLFVPCGWDGSQTSPTITAHNANGSQRMPDKEHFNCVIQTYGISAYDSNAMKSSNPHSGVYEADTSRCLDLNGGNPACNQGGMAVVCVDQGGGKSSCSILDNLSPTLACTHAGEPVIAVEGNGTRPSHKGSGYSEDNVSFTLNATEQHGVAYSADDAKVYDARGNGDGEIANTITGDHNGHINDYTTICKQGYIVRRLTPTECARLQGFPDWWCADLDTPDPTENDIAYWSEVFETYRKVVNPDGKPKTKKQIIKWLQHPHTDSAEYKMWGNGVALPCVCYIMQGIASIMSED